MEKAMGLPELLGNHALAVAYLHPSLEYLDEVLYHQGIRELEINIFRAAQAVGYARALAIVRLIAKANLWLDFSETQALLVIN